MSKADNKELEEVINYIENIIEMFYEFPNPRSVLIKDCDILNLEIALKELKKLQEDYIAKDKIREKIEERKTLLDTKCEQKKFWNKEDYVRVFEIEILKELLEGK